MADTKTFHLPDLGEGLPDATIVEWFVKPGDTIKLDEPLVSMETAKAVVEVPAPFSGKVAKLYGKGGDVIDTGAALIDVEIDPKLPQRADAESTGHSHAPKAAPTKGPGSPAPDDAKKVIASEDGGEISTNEKKPATDSGTVVGAVEASDRVVSEQAIAVGGVKAMPAVRALAKKLNVELSKVIPTGNDNVVTLADVKKAAEAGSARRGPSSQASPATSQARPTAVNAPVAAARTNLSVSGQPVRTSPPKSDTPFGQPDQLKGVRRNMARVMADAHSKVVPTTLVDDADINAWQPGNDITVRLIRAIVTACKKVPALNAWFDGDNLTRTLHPHVDIGIAVDTDDGLFVPALRNADVLDATGLRAALNRIRDQVQNRTIPADELKGYTISLSNFGMFAGRYATPVVVPPCVAIVAAGKLRHEVVAVMGAIETHRVIPLSVTFDHRAATGGEAARFLRAMLDDLSLAR
jgi:2-oxoisovalerate dehydrogenase E2 component (dihydrolipoyl transacylase)